MDLKEAKEKCKELLEHNYLEDLGYLRVENHYINFNTAIDTILQELDNLQKENEELKSKIIEVEKENLVQKAVIYEECISKDKIRIMIKAIEELLPKFTSGDVRNRLSAKKQILEELLKEE